MKQEKDFKVGETCIYREDGAIIRCKVRETKNNGSWLWLTLEVLSMVQKSPIHHSVKEPGEVFPVSKPMGLTRNPLIWEIEEESAVRVG